MIWKGGILRPGQTGRAPAAVRKAEVLEAYYHIYPDGSQSEIVNMSKAAA